MKPQKTLTISGAFSADLNKLIHAHELKGAPFEILAEQLQNTAAALLANAAEVKKSWRLLCTGDAPVFRIAKDHTGRHPDGLTVRAI